MKKLGLLLIAILFLAPVANAQVNQDIKIGVGAGLPLGNIKDYSKVNLSIDAAYLFEVADMVYVGPLINYSHYFAKTFHGVKIKDVQHLPLAVSGRINFGLENAVFLGADLGYAIGISKGTDGGTYYRPKIGYDFGNLAAIVSYSGIDDVTSINSLNLGVEFSL